tara:strand:- start:1279 stop:1485 length:207 start_codon:yes stop_codon:yes gene_type:complete
MRRKKMPETIQWEIPDEGYERIEKLEKITEEIQKMIDDSRWEEEKEEFIEPTDDDGGWFDTYDPDDSM